PEPPKKPSNWRRKHEEFIATIRAAKGLNLKDGGKLPPPPPPSYDPGCILLQYKPAAVKKMPSAASAPPPSSSSRLPQPSGVSKAVVGMK
ncbi:hypothetical protein CIB84_011320, partial [Bambusicola thoracicus]